MKILCEIRMSTLKSNQFFIIPFFIFYIAFMLLSFFPHKIISNINLETNDISNLNNYTNYSLFNNVYNAFHDDIYYLIISNRNKFINETEQIFKNQKFIKHVLIFENEETYKNYKENNKNNLTIEFRINDKKEIDIYLVFNSLKIDPYEKTSNELNLGFLNSEAKQAIQQIYYFSNIQQIITYLFTKISNNLFIPDIQVELLSLNLSKASDLNPISFIYFIHFIFQTHFLFIFFFIINEKKSQIFNLLIRHGISLNQNYLSWALIYMINYIFFIIISFIIIYRYFSNIKIYLIIFSMILYILNDLSFFLFLQTFLKNTRQFLIVYNIIIFILITEFIFEYLDFSLKQITFITLLFPQINYLKIIENLPAILMFDEFNWKYLSMNYFEDFSVWFYLIFSIIIIIIYFSLYILSLYFKKTKLLNSNYLIENKNINIEESNLFSENEYFEIQNKPLNDENHEELNEKEKEYKVTNNYLSIKGLTKKYDDIIVINKLSMELFPGELFCLLGESGAGKTTLINIISGLIEPDEGEILYKGISLIKNNEYLNQNIGLCNQEDILFENLTVKEHLYYFFKFRGENYNNEKIDIFLKNIKLNEIENKLCKHLSKGEKRKLSIALSLIGNNNIILLDEPTSGLDTNSRKELWKFLKENKKDKIIIITTHSLEEAEFLSDKIGIIKDGKYICSGTSSFLKKKYSKGFNLSLIINENQTAEDRQNLINQFNEIDNKIININSKNLVVIKFNTNDKEEINNIFKIISDIKENHDIKYTISTTSIEDVFISLNNEDKNEKNINNLNNINEIKDDTIIPFITQFYVNFKRKLYELLNIKYYSFFIIQLIILLIFKWYENHSSKNLNFYEIENLFKLNNKIDIYTNDINYIKSSSYYKQLNISFNLINNTKYFENISLFQSYINKSYKYDELLFKKIIILFERNIINKKIRIYNLYFPNAVDYFQAIMNMLINIITEKELNLNVNSLKGYINYYPNNKNIPKKINKYFMLILLMNIFIIQFFIIINNRNELNLKHFLYLNGINKINYWLGIFSFNLIIIMIYIIELYIYVKNYNFLFLIFLYLITFTLFIYFISLLINFVFFFYIIDFVISFIIFYFLNNNEKSFQINDALLFTYFLKIIYDFYKEEKKNFNYYRKLLIIKSLIFGILIILFEKGLFKKLNFCKINYYKIQNIISKRIKQTQNIELFKTLIVENKKQFKKEQEEKVLEEKMNIRIINLTKIYYKFCKKKKIALNKINLALKKNEKLGLLGFNESGKSTLIKSLINEIEYEGEIILFQKELKTNFNELKKSIGYCPQEDYLFNNLTVKETLIFYKSLKNIKTKTKELSEKFDLEKYLYTKCKDLSKGNKRKLCFAISIMSKPELLLLDEPTVDIDSKSRKKIYKIIKNEIKSNMILITHSIEESKLLCDNISWLNNGEFECIGNFEELKLKYSVGYIFQIKIKHYNNDNYSKNNNSIESFITLKSKINNFDLLDNTIKNDYYYLNNLNIIIDSIKEYCFEINLIEFYIDNYSFEFIIKIKEDKEFFERILNLKNNYEFVEEFCIRMESLENIFINAKKKSF